MAHLKVKGIPALEIIYWRLYHIMHQNYTRQAPELTYPIHADQTTTLMQHVNGKKQK